MVFIHAHTLICPHLVLRAESAFLQIRYLREDVKTARFGRGFQHCMLSITCAVLAHAILTIYILCTCFCPVPLLLHLNLLFPSRWSLVLRHRLSIQWYFLKAPPTVAEQGRANWKNIKKSNLYILHSWASRGLCIFPKYMVDLSGYSSLGTQLLFWVALGSHKLASCLIYDRALI